MYYTNLNSRINAEFRKKNQILIKNVYEFAKVYKDIVLKEHDQIV